MKKSFTSIMIIVGVSVFGQIGIGTPTPRGALDINKGTTNNMGLVLPTNANVSNIITPQGGNVIPGTIIYDSTNDCMRLYKGINVWGDCLADSPVTGPVGGIIGNIDCDNATNVGGLFNGSPASGVSSSIPYTGGNGGAYTGQAIPSTGVDGLTATLSPGNFSNGNGTLSYTITGTPASVGEAVFTITIGGQSCQLRLTVGTPAVAGLDCANVQNLGFLYEGVTAVNVRSLIPYTGGNGSAYAGQTVTSQGVTGLTATLSPGSFATGSGDLTYTITGTPSSSGVATFNINIGGMSCTFTRRVSARGGGGSSTGGEGIYPDMRILGVGHQALTNSISLTDGRSFIMGGIYGHIAGTTRTLTSGSPLPHKLHQYTIADLRQNFEIISVGVEHYTEEDIAKLVKYTEIGGVVIIQLDSSTLYSPATNRLIQAFGMTGEIGVGGSNATASSVNSLSNIFGDTGGVNIEGYPSGAKVLPSQLPPGSTIYATEADGAAAVWTPGGFEGRAIFIWNDDIFIQSLVQNKPQHPFIKNLLAYAFDKAYERLFEFISIPEEGVLPKVRIINGPHGINFGPSIYNQMAKTTYYGATGTYSGINGFTRHAWASYHSGMTGGQLRQRYDIMFAGGFVEDFNLQFTFSKLGGGVIISQYNYDSIGHRNNIFLHKFNFIGYVSYKTMQTVPSLAKIGSVNFSNIFGDITGHDIMNNSHNADMVSPANLPLGSTIFATSKALDTEGNILAFTPGGFGGRVIFFGSGMVNNNQMNGDIIDTPEEKFVHNMLSYLMDKLKGL